MRSSALVILAGAALAAMTAPADAAWKSYISHKLGISFEAPGTVKTESGISRGVIAGPQENIVFRSVDDNIEYKVTVTDFSQAAEEGATLLGEAHFDFEQGKKVLMDTFGRVEPNKDAVYGRKVTADLPNNGGRATAAFYFTKGRLYVLQATVLPANGDYTSPDPGRFVDSIAFAATRAQAGSIELKLPE